MSSWWQEGEKSGAAGKDGAGVHAGWGRGASCRAGPARRCLSSSHRVCPMPSPSAGARCGEDSMVWGLKARRAPSPRNGQQPTASSSRLPLRDRNREPRVRAWPVVRHSVCSSVHSKELNCWVCWWEKIQPDILITLTRHFKLVQISRDTGGGKIEPQASIFELPPAPTCRFM